MNARVPTHLLNTADALRHVTQAWDSDITQRITDYIAVPAKSPGFDADWAANGYIDTVMRQAADWVTAQKIPNLKLEVLRLTKPDGTPRTPVLFFEIPAHQHASTDTVLMYGHLDKQPEFEGWRNDLGPWTAKLETGSDGTMRLYGRGSADDGYAVYASI